MHRQERLSFDIISGNESHKQKALEIAHRQGHEQDRLASCDRPVYVYDCKDDRGDDITTAVLTRICEALKCNVGDIVDFIPEDIDEARSERVD